ncbi:MAG: ABC transporter substrate-binding protein [Fusobacteriaceae bacterium]|jgi:peptide/nickel transport system substrate-binding protein|nr:ABC transporter substrate-binding protein [Fusobacteriaceae bacterium]
MKRVKLFGKLILIFTMMTLILTVSVFGKNAKKSVSNEKVIKTLMGVDLDSLNPYKMVSSASEEIMMNVYEGLVMPSEDGGIKPAIAESYSVSEDGLTYKFKIRKGIKFHNGNPLDIKDVEYSLNRMAGKDVDKVSSSAFINIDKIIVDNEDEVNIVLTKPDSSFIYHMIEGIIPDENKENLEKIAIGTGPFKVSEYEKEYGIVLEKFDDYWGEKAKIDKVDIKIAPDSGMRFLKFLSGEIDILTHIDAKRVNELKDHTVVSGPQNLVFLLALNHKFTPFSDKRVREAINLVVDKEKLITTALDGYGVPLETNMSPAMKEVCIDNIGHKTDIEKAKALLKEAGQENLKFTLRTSTLSSIYTNSAQVLKEQLKEVGITVEIETMEWATWLDEVYTGKKHEATVIGLSGKLDPEPILIRYTTPYAKNFFNYSNKEYDDLIEKAKITNNDAERILIYKKAQEILRDDNAAVYLVDPDMLVGMKKGIKGYVFYPLAYMNFAKLTIED